MRNLQKGKETKRAGKTGGEGLKSFKYCPKLLRQDRGGEGCLGSWDRQHMPERRTGQTHGSSTRWNEGKFLEYLHFNLRTRVRDRKNHRCTKGSSQDGGQKGLMITQDPEKKQRRKKTGDSGRCEKG